MKFDPSVSSGGSLMAGQARPSADRRRDRLEFETLERQAAAVHKPASAIADAIVALQKATPADIKAISEKLAEASAALAVAAPTRVMNSRRP